MPKMLLGLPTLISDKKNKNYLVIQRYALLLNTYEYNLVNTETLQVSYTGLHFLKETEIAL
jgi:hypothetical protein